MSLSNTSKPSSHRLIVFIEILIVALALPITVIATHQAVSITPRAYGPDSSTGNFQSSLSLNTPLLSQTINCRLGEPCTGSFEGSGIDADGQLTMAIDFLPPNLTQNTCKPTHLVKSTSLSCSFSGTPTRQGEFKLLITLKNSHDQSKQQVVTLNIR